MPSRKEIQWAQLKVGALVLAATAVLIGLIFLMTGASGGLFAHQITLRCYFPNASGLKVGAPVTLEGVTIGNVVGMHMVPDQNPNPVEVVMQVGERDTGATCTPIRTQPSPPLAYWATVLSISIRVTLRARYRRTTRSCKRPAYRRFSR